VTGPTVEPPHPNGAVHQSGITRARRRRRNIFLVLGIALVAAWLFAIVWSVTVTSSSPERMDKNAAAAVTAACTDAQNRLRALPNPFPRAGADRVARIESENDALRNMVERFGTVRPMATTPASALEAWADDWTRVIDARDKYADALAATEGTDNRVKFIVPAERERSVKPVTGRMDDFVRENHPDLSACFTQALELETVEGPREYEKVTE
jgi:hypothetical protein